MGVVRQRVAVDEAVEFAVDAVAAPDAVGDPRAVRQPGGAGLVELVGGEVGGRLRLRLIVVARRLVLVARRLVLVGRRRP